MNSTLTLPIRLGLRIAHSAVRTGVSLSQDALGLLVGLAGRGSTPPPPPPDPVRPDRTEPPSARTTSAVAGDATAPAAPATPAAPPADAFPPPVEVPAHVSSEPTVVESFAEPGAEDGAGAELHVDAPWPGYRELTARDVIDRLQTAEPGQLTLVALYERMHRNRSTVLKAAERELRSRT